MVLKSLGGGGKIHDDPLFICQLNKKSGVPPPIPPPTRVTCLHFVSQSAKLVRNSLYFRVKDFYVINLNDNKFTIQMQLISFFFKDCIVLIVLTYFISNDKLLNKTV